MSRVRAVGRSLAGKERLAYGCGTNLYGHDPHHMAVLSLHRRGVRGAKIRDVRLLDGVTVEVDVDPIERPGPRVETLVWRNHDAVRLATLWAAGCSGQLYSDRRLLGVHQPAGGTAWFSVTDGALGECNRPRCQPM